MVCWVLTKEMNEYDQYGEYFMEVFKEKPDFQKLLKVLIGHGISLDCDPSEPKIEHVVGNLIRKGGGRINYEHTWFYLKEVEMI